MRYPALRSFVLALAAASIVLFAGTIARADFVFDGPGLGNQSVQFGAPVIVVAHATRSSGAVVNFTVTETPLYAPFFVLDLGCDHASGSRFPVGITLVTCQEAAYDQFGSFGTDYTTILVVVDRDAAFDQFGSYRDDAVQASLMAKLEKAQNQLSHGKTAPACNTLRAFLDEVQAQTGKKLTAAQAATLTTGGKNARLILSCQ